MTDMLETKQRRDEDEAMAEIILDCGYVVMINRSLARRAPGGWRLASAKGADVFETFETFFSSLITPPDGITLDEVFAKLSINDVQRLVEAITPFLVPSASTKSMR